MTSSPKIVPTNQIPHEEIDPDALKVIRRLRRFGHEAYLVGGCVRDLLLDAHPKDFDVITSARPRQVRRIFSNSRVIGRRFRLVHVIFGENIIEVSTFRADPGQFVEKAELGAEGAPEEAPGEEGAARATTEDAEATAEPGAVTSGATPAPPALGAGEPTPAPATFLRDEPSSDERPALAAGESGSSPRFAGSSAEPSESGRLVGIRPETVPGAEPAGAPGEPVSAPVTPLEAASQLPDESLEATDLDERAASERPGAGRPADEARFVGRETPAPRRAFEARVEDDEDADLDDPDWDPRRGRRRRPRPEFDGNNIFGTPEEDARRRDFTINALFYDPERREIIDYVEGLRDIERGLVNPINDPLGSFAEDPVRMIRAVRFAAKLGFEIEKRALDAINTKKFLIADCSQRRILEEIFKILKGGHAAASLRTLEETGILCVLLPEIGEWLAQDAPLPASSGNGNGAAHAAPPNGTAALPAPAIEASARPDAPPAAPSAALVAHEPLAPPPAAPAPQSTETAPPSDTAGEPSSATTSTTTTTPATATTAATATPSAGPSAPTAEGAPSTPAEGSSSAAPPPAPSETPAPDTSAPPVSAALGAPAPSTATPTPAPLPAPSDEIRLGPIPSWEPPAKAIEAYLRVTWEHPPKEGPNDWVEDPHEEIEDAIFEAAAFARDAILERFGFTDVAGLPAERERARAVMKVLQLNQRLQDAIAWVEEQARVDAAVDRSARRERGGRWRERRERFRSERRARAPEPRPPERRPAPGPTPSTAHRRPPVSRREVLHRYLEGLDKMLVEGVPLSTGVQLAALYGPMLREALDRALAARGAPSAETVIDEIMRPIALRHSLARRDRDRVKRIVLAMRRLLRDLPPQQSVSAGAGRGRRRSRGGQRLLGKDYFQEALVLLWLHARATGEGWESFRHWQARALAEKRSADAHKRREGDRRDERTAYGREPDDDEDDDADDDDADGDDDDRGDDEGDESDRDDRPRGDRFRRREPVRRDAPEPGRRPERDELDRD